MTLQELEGALEEAISKLGAHLIELEIRGEGKGKSVEVFIDAEQAITADICSQTSRSVEQVIEANGIIKGPYRITVSSPGIVRPLLFPWQYTKHVGRDLDIELKAGEEGKRTGGKLESVTATGIVLAAAKNKEQETILFTDIVEARVRAPW
jgi:ribosome maturation factor RimP